MKELDFKHRFKVVNGEFVWEDKDVFDYVKKELEGKNGYAIIKEEEKDITPNQFAYYFGGIIRKECMNSNAFLGWTEMEIHDYLLREVEGNVKVAKTPHGNVAFISTPDFKLFRKNKMAEYITKVIALLQTEFDIHPKPPEHYRYNKFYIPTKVYKNENMERDT